MITTAGSANVSVYFYIVQDASATSPGEPITGLLFSDIETGGSASYVRQGAARTDLTLITLASASATHADGGFILVDDTNMPGLYRCDYPDAAFATGVDQVMLQIVVASGKNAVASPIFVEITDVDLRDSVRGGMTALPNAAADAAGGLPISDAGGLDIDAKLANTNEITAVRMAALTDWIDGGRLDLLLDAILVDTGEIGTAGAGLTNITINSASIDLFWDEALTGATHNVVNSGGRRLRQLQEAGGYIGAIWLDTAIGTAGTTNFENGTDTMPVNNLVDANILAASLSLSIFNCAPGANITLAAAQENQSFRGEGWTVALGGQSIAGTSFSGADINGIGTGVPHEFHDCNFGATSLAGGGLIECGLKDTITLTGAVVYSFLNCSHEEPGTASTIDFAAAGSTEVHVHHWHGNLLILNMGTGDILHFTCADGSLTMDATCTGGTRNSAGNFGLTDNSSGMTINDLGQSYQRLGAPAGASISADVAAVKVDTAATLVDTAVIGAAGVGLTDLGGMSTAMKAEILTEVVKLFTTQMAETYAADGTVPTLEQALMLIQQSLHEFAIAGTTRTVKKLDGAATAATFTLNDATNPTSTTRAT